MVIGEGVEVTGECPGGFWILVRSLFPTLTSLRFSDRYRKQEQAHDGTWGRAPDFRAPLFLDSAIVE